MTRILLSLFLYILIVFFSSSCKNDKKQSADLIIHGGTIYTVNDSLPQVEVVVVKGNKILFAGQKNEAFEYESENTEIIDLGNKIMIPGFIDSHGHFLGMGNSKLILDLSSVKNFDEVVDIVSKAVQKAQDGEWIIGRGWHQDKWSGTKEGFVYGFPTHNKLSEVSPRNPVFLSHASGHSSLVNEYAMELAGITFETVDKLQNSLSGGEIILDSKRNPTGILNENAELLVQKIMPDQTDEDLLLKKFNAAVKECQTNGITSFHDAGISANTVSFYQKMKDEGKLGVRLNAMLYNDSALLSEWFQKGPYLDTLDYMLQIRSVKLLADGALGNRGAWLNEAYEDKPDWFGLNTISLEEMKIIAAKCLQNGFQLCIHAIGDRANHEVLNIYEAAFTDFPELSKNHRFRIEHAQHLLNEDIPRFAALEVLAAIQAIHMSSDRPWAIDRLGKDRILEGAYVWKKLFDSGAHLMNGTDVPVEPVNPIACFYASVTRKTLDGEPENGYEPEQKMTREQALKTYTINGAFGSFEEEIKGSIEIGKLADFVILDKDIMTIPEDEILSTKVFMTILNGQIVYLSE